MLRMLGVMAFATSSGMGLLLLVKNNGDFGARAVRSHCLRWLTFCEASRLTATHVFARV